MGDPARVNDLDDMLRKLYHMLPPEEILRKTGLKPADLLRALTPEQRLEGLSGDQLRRLVDEAQRRMRQGK